MITKELRKKLVILIDHKVKAGIFEFADGPLINLALKKFDEYVMPLLPEDFQVAIVEALENLVKD